MLNLDSLGSVEVSVASIDSIAHYFGVALLLIIMFLSSKEYGFDALRNFCC